MKMQRRHFEFIARNLLAMQPKQTLAGNGMPTTKGRQWGDIVMQFSCELAETNEYFKRPTFLYACGMTNEMQQAGGWV